MSLPGCSGFRSLAVSAAGIDIDRPAAHLQTGPRVPQLDIQDHPKVTAYVLGAAVGQCHDLYGDLLQDANTTADKFSTRKDEG